MISASQRMVSSGKLRVNQVGRRRRNPLTTSRRIGGRLGPNRCSYSSGSMWRWSFSSSAICSKIRAESGTLGEVFREAHVDTAIFFFGGNGDGQHFPLGEVREFLHRMS